MPKLIPKRLSSHEENTRQVAKPELLSPAGTWDCARAAVENGADAIFFGLERFNARMRGKNFTVADLPELMAYLHSRGVKGYVTFNILVFSDEMADAEDFLRSIIAAGVDAAIVQDVGICRLIRRISPDFPIHASTQMSVTSEAGIEFARELGSSVVVLARETSLKEVGAIREKTIAAGTEVPIELFVHGALCVAYSGQCLTSESLGGRSANRGECAQACRLPYELYSNGKQVDLGDRRYLLSPQDLSGLDAMPEIIKNGVATLKIEGRLKAPEYVAAVTQVYRKALDDAWNEYVGATSDATAQSSSVGGTSSTSSATHPDPKYQLEMTFSRGLSDGWLNGIDNQKLVHARFGKKRGLRLGIVKSIEKDGVLLELEAPLKAGDGVVFDRGRPDEQEEGGRITSVDTRGRDSFVRFLNDSINWKRVNVGDTLFKTSDPALDKALRQSYEVEQPNYTRPITATVHGEPGKLLTLELRDEVGRVARSESTEPLQEAAKRALDDETLTKQLSRLGATPFHLASLDNRLVGNCHFPVSQINQLRRDAVDTLTALRREPLRWTLNHPRSSSSTSSSSSASTSSSAYPSSTLDSKASTIIPYLRSFEQLEAALTLPYRELYLELENPKHYKKAVELVHAAPGDKKIWVAPPRMFKTGEDWVVKQLTECGADGFLARNHEHLKSLSKFPLRGDFSLNVANHLTAEYLMERYQLQRLTASYDLNATQLAALLENAPANWFEITLHQHMPMFHMEHCVFCAFLSDGKDFRDCGRPCDKHSVSIKDRTGMLHPLKADAGCRNTVFNAKAQTGAEFAQDLLNFGVRHFRVEFLNESPEEVRDTLDRYERLLAGKLSGQSLWRELKLINQLGVTRGTLREK
ncbi:U32 family peptidase [Pelagicoccus sp. NFK12]|uniref:U32 family peptidase n=1 Tax=Pelagicoccus enzymogenes TaxID=2773457 RepID=A0A927FDN3_9BACT|nr:U32 family peptidase [Pelagicoccus enzymogenes]MBD5781866.1 U32 family peptidase [Pelagicoccus enzymogenes]